MSSIKDKVLFVTGAASGIGRGILEHFASFGAKLVFCDMDNDKGVELAGKLGAKFYQIDVKDAQALRAAMQDVADTFGGIDILINNVGMFKHMPILDSTVDDFDEILATNLRPTFVCSQFFVQLRRNDKAHYGRIINIASTRHQQSEPEFDAYAASKGGIVSLTHSLAISLADFNITVNAISPGWIDTGYYPVSESDKQQHPSLRVGYPDDVARLCAFLCEEKNDFINGENIAIDGGMSKKMIYLE